MRTETGKKPSASVPRPAPPGPLRLLVVFHESDLLGAGISVLRALDELRSFGWTPSGWFPGEGPLVGEASATLATFAHEPKPLAYSLRGWRAGAGLRARLRASPGYLRAFRSELLRLRPHVVHANTLRSLPEAAVARRLGLPVVLHVHELPPPGLKRTLTLRWADKVADVFVAVSSPVTDLLRAQAPSTPVVTVHNGVAGDDRRGPELASTVGTVGSICPTKGTDVFLEAAALALERSPDLRFEHVGQSLEHEAEFAAHISSRAGSPPLREAVSLLGRKLADEAIRRWEIFVLPSRQDSFPLASLEAMAAGLPVIASDVGGLSEQIVHLESGVLVPPEDAAALAEWIVRLHNDPALRERLGRRAAERVEATFTLARQADGLHKAYLAALNLRHAPSFARQATLEAL